MEKDFQVQYRIDLALDEQLLEEIIRQLPLGLICTDHQGRILFMNDMAQELLESNCPQGQRENHGKEHAPQKLPPEIRWGIRYFGDFLTQGNRAYQKPFPKLYVQNQTDYDLEFLAYCPYKELTRATWAHARIIILLKAGKWIPPTAGLAKQSSLSNREKQMLQSLIAGKARKEIAAEMRLSEDTVRSYLRRLYKKLGVRSRVEAATLGLRMELLENLKSVLQIET